MSNQENKAENNDNKEDSTKLIEKEEVEEEEEEGEKIKLKMSYDTMKRIQYDPNYPSDQFTVVYLDRFVGMKECQFEDFLVGEVPYHRIFYIKLNGHVVWDRKLRRNLLADGSALQFVKKTEEELKEEEIKREMLKEEEKISEKQIIFNTSKNRKIYKQYTPEDGLERWMLMNNDESCALVTPTHVSQRGGYYCIQTKDMPTLVKEWAKCIEKKEKFYMEEMRTEKCFRLYLDIDIKTTNRERFGKIKEWIPEIQKITVDYFSEKCKKEKMKVNANVCVLDSHGVWKDSKCKEANFKSGFRFYYTFVYVDEETMTDFTKVLGEKLEKKFGDCEVFPKKNWKFSDIVDLEQCHHKRARMVGSTKHRRGNDLGRTYKMMGYFNSKGTQLEDFEKKIDNENLCYLTSVREYSNDDLSYFEKKEFQRLKVLIFTKDKVENGKTVIKIIKD